ncbi:MAG: hypothetical protein BGP14_20385 [Sphingobacteriales bacterium 44-15]|nr:MAG: hypothetical protein BGP14_20385 [Sphingobacteriales bacterium 44-15]
MLSLLQSQTINIVGDGSVCNPLGLEVKLSEEPGQLLFCAADGLFASGQTFIQAVSYDDNGNIFSNIPNGEALKDAEDPVKNIALGYNAGSPTWDVSNSIFIGENAGALSWYNENMIALGTNAGYAANQSFDLIAIGTNAGRDGFSGMEEGDYSIQIGRNTSSSGFKNSILLGGSTSPDNFIVNTKDNQFMLAPNIVNLRFCSLDYELPDYQPSGTTTLTNDGSGKLSWSGYPTPLLTSGSVPYIGNNGKLTETNSNLFWDSTNKRLGIGNNTPAYALDVTGQIRQTANTDLIIARTTDNILIGISLPNSAGLERGFAKLNTQTGEFRLGGGAGGYYPTFYSNGVERIRVSVDGYVGIGTNSPSALLSLAASTTARASLNFITGTAPTAPNTGDIWRTSSGIFLNDSLNVTGDVIFGTTGYGGLRQSSVWTYLRSQTALGFCYGSTSNFNPSHNINSTGLALGGGSTGATALLDVYGSTTSIPSIRIRSGVAPTSPLDGSIWYDGSKLYLRVGGVTKEILFA